jgi:tetratricopeptide (TPR) repeat protein
LANSRKSTSRVAQAVVGSGSGSRRGARSRDRARVRTSSHARVKAGHKRPGPVDPEKQRIDIQYQSLIRNFETAVRAFQKQKYDKAAEIFEKLTNSDTREVAERARVHLRLCRQRTKRAAQPAKSAEEYYTLGIASLNDRKLGLAIEQLSKADKLKSNQDYIRYALAAVQALLGNLDIAIEHLEAAIALHPENRIHARRDEDFQGLASDPRFRRLIYAAGP